MNHDTPHPAILAPNLPQLREAALSWWRKGVGDRAGVLAFCEANLPSARQAGDTALLAQLLLLRGRVASSICDAPTSERLLGEARRLFRKLRDPLGLRRVAMLAALSYADGQDAASQAHEAALRRCIAKGSLSDGPADLFLALNGLARFAYARGDIVATLTQLYDLLDRLAGLPDSDEFAMAMGNIGSHLLDAGDFQGALLMLSETEPLVARLAARYPRINNKANLSLCYQLQGRLDRALEVVRELLANPEFWQPPLPNFTVLTQARDVLLLNGCVEEAGPLVALIAANPPLPNDLVGQACMVTGAAMIAATEGDPARALALLLEHGSRFEHVTDATVRMLAMQLMSEYAAKMGDFEAAYRYHKRYHAELTGRLAVAVEAGHRSLKAQLDLRHLRGERARAVDDRRKSERRRAELAKLNRQLEMRIAEVSSLRDQMRDQALHDPLTGLANRRHLETHGEELLGAAKASGGKLALMLCDLDRFKEINDSFGHAAGDALLVAFAKFLQSQIRGDDFAARFAGDEFIVIFSDLDAAAATARAEAMIAAWRQVAIRADTCVITGQQFSAGIAGAAASTVDVRDWVRAADAALYAGKRAGRGRARAADPI